MPAATLQLVPRIAAPPRPMSSTVSLIDPLDVGFAEGHDGSSPRSQGESVAHRPSSDDVKAALARVLASRTFAHSARHRVFLRYVVDNTLAGRARAVKEVVIGLDVFGRKLDGFDPRRDSIVRVEARRLRRKLQSYYCGEGRQDVVEIRLEVGGYVPTFAFRDRTRTARVALPLVLVVPFKTVADDLARLVAAGLRDQLAASLTAIDGLRVMTSVPALPTRRVVDGRDRLIVQDDPGYLVDGSVMRMGSRWRCISHLTSMRDGIRRWSRSFDFGPIESASTGDVDLFALQDHVADASSAAMRAELQRMD